MKRQDKGRKAANKAERNIKKAIATREAIAPLKGTRPGGRRPGDKKR